MSSERTCPDCDEPLTEMELELGGTFDDVHVVSDKSSDGLLGVPRVDEMLRPIPYVCPECRRILFYGEG
ncbi:hypothetical protein [Haloarchaeobius sp. HRN-SO-5]|uniref:hypothetical protein n=1 Tax=Haloarchaeobius sp. HRN-SO-5 TaxID=3446118 RepID=UPI003EC12B07